MPLITFTHPDYKDKTVYLPAGSFTETLLKIAKVNKIPIAFNCEEGECGSCLVHVEYLGDESPKGYHMEEKEIKVLRELGKLSKEDVDRIMVEDIPSEWRLACQFIPRDEDIVVEYQAQ